MGLAELVYIHGMKNSLRTTLLALLVFSFASTGLAQASSSFGPRSVPNQVANALTVGIQTAASQNCMGMFVAPRVVVTAAHCVRSGVPQYIRKVNGGIFSRMKIAQVVSHPKYKGDVDTDPFDIAYVVLKTDPWSSKEVFEYLVFSGLPSESSLTIAINFAGPGRYEFKKATLLNVPSQGQGNYVTDFQVLPGSSGGPLFAVSGDYLYLLGTVRNGKMNFASDGDSFTYQITNDPKYINVKDSKIFYSNIRLDNDWLLRELVAKKLIAKDKLK